MEPKNTTDHNPLEWLKANLALEQSGSVEFIYDYMESQSCQSLPVIYTPFDGRNRMHFVDQAQILDFALVAGPGRVLDFGPGDGWPSLRIAPIVEEVVGVDGSPRRVEVCRANALKLGIKNARFIHVPPGNPLPFADNTFDGITAASSIEQTLDPRATLKELYRVLKPGGKIRISTEILDIYRGGYEREGWLFDVDDERTHLIIFDRQPDKEVVHHYGLSLSLAKREVEQIFTRFDAEPNYAGLKPDILEALAQHLTQAVTWTTHHPANKTLLRWLKKVGFQESKLTYSGGWFAKQLFHHLAEAERPAELSATGAFLRPIIEIVVDMEVPLVVSSPKDAEMVTGIK